MKLLKLCFLLFSTTSLLGTINDDLLQASKDGNLEQVENLIERGADANAIDRCYGTALMKAAYKGHLPVIQYLIDHGADVNARDRFGINALMLAARDNHLPVVKYLIEHGADVNAKDNDDETALMEAADNGHLPVVQYLVEHGADVNAKDDTNWTPLTWAARNGHLSVVQYLIKHDTDVNTANNFGETTLMGAAFNGHLTIVRYLIEHGADVNAKTNNGKTALTWAIHKNHHNIVALIELCQQPGFEEFRADPSKFMEEQQLSKKPLPQQRIFLWSIILNHYDVFATLLNKKISPNTCDRHKMTALMYAVITGNKYMVQILVNNGAQIHRENEWDENAIQLAVKYGHLSIAAGFILRQKMGKNIW